MTHKEKVLALLADGKPHSHHEGYGLGVILHSRVADLRRDGHRIEQWRVGDLYLYQLLSEPAIGPAGSLNSIGAEGEPQAAVDLGGSAAVSYLPVVDASPEAPDFSGVQLSFGDAA